MTYFDNLSWLRRGESPTEDVLNRPLRQLLANTQHIQETVDGTLIPLVNRGAPAFYRWNGSFDKPYPVIVLASDGQLYKLTVAGDPTVDPTLNTGDWEGPYPLLTDALITDASTVEQGITRIAVSGDSTGDSTGAKYAPAAIANNRALQYQYIVDPTSTTLPQGRFRTLTDALNAVPTGHSATISILGATQYYLDGETIEVYNKNITVLGPGIAVARNPGSKGHIRLVNSSVHWYTGQVHLGTNSQDTPLFQLQDSTLILAPPEYQQRFTVPALPLSQGTIFRCFENQPITDKTAVFSVSGVCTLITINCVYLALNNDQPRKPKIFSPNSSLQQCQFLDYKPIGNDALTDQFRDFDISTVPLTQGLSVDTRPDQGTTCPITSSNKVPFLQYMEDLASSKDSTLYVFNLSQVDPLRGLSLDHSYIQDKSTIYGGKPNTGRVDFRKVSNYGSIVPGIAVADFGAANATVDPTLRSDPGNNGGSQQSNRPAQEIGYIGPTLSIDDTLSMSGSFTVSFLLVTPIEFSGVNNVFSISAAVHDGTDNTNTLCRIYIDGTGLYVEHEYDNNLVDTTNLWNSPNTEAARYLTVVRDNSNSEYRMYMDGQFFSSYLYTNSPSIGISPSTHHIHIATDPHDNTVTQFRIQLGLMTYIPRVMNDTEIEEAYEILSGHPIIPLP